MTVTSMSGAAQAAPARILALGDSLTAGYGVQQNEAFPAKLEQKLREEGLDVIVENAGVSGDTSAGGLARLDWVLSGDKPDFAIIELGANDGLRGLPTDQTEANLDAIMKRFQDADVPILLAGMYAPPNMGREYGEQFSGMYPRLAEKYGAILYPFFLDGVIGEANLMQRDNLHPNAQGVDEIVERILPYVMRMLEPAP